MRTITTPDAPLPAGHYSQAIEHNGLIHIAAQLSLDPADPSRRPSGSIEAQAERAITNLLASVRAAGSNADHILKVTIYLADIAHWDKVNTIYTRLMGSAKPARAVIPVSGSLHFGSLIAVDATAAMP